MVIILFKHCFSALYVREIFFLDSMCYFLIVYFVKDLPPPQKKDLPPKKIYPPKKDLPPKKTDLPPAQKKKNNNKHGSCRLRESNQG